MEKRKLGKSGIEFAPIAFGGNVFGWTADEATSHKLLDAFVDAGFSFVDTADVYSRWVPGHKGGESETIIGNWLKKDPAKRAKVQIATKCGMEMPSEGQGLSRAHIVKSVDASLKRLNTDRIDLFQSHKDDAATPQEETLTTYGELVKAGKIGAIGASNFDAKRLAEAAAISKAKGELENECLKEGIGVIPYYSLASGFLSGKYRSEADVGDAKRSAGVKKYINPKGMAVLKALDEAARKTGSNPAQVALAWLMQRKSITAPIVSATSLKQLDDIVKSASIKLDPESLAAIDKASAP